MEHVSNQKSLALCGGFQKIIGLLNFLKHSMLNVICNVNVKEEEETEVPLIPQM